mgnify:CR=1 FL=1
MDWNHDGDEDYSDGIVSGIFYAAPISISFLIIVASVLIYVWVNS